MRLLFAAVLASLTSACATAHLASPELAPMRFETAAAAPEVLRDNHFATDRVAGLTETEMKAILAAPVFLEDGSRLGVLPVASRYELDGAVPQESTPAEVSDTLESSGLFELTTEVTTDWPTDRGVAGLRELASRYRVEYLLLYRQRFAEDQHSNAWAALYPTLIGIFAAPGETVEQAGVLEATLFDVKTGTILFTVHERVRGELSTTPPLAGGRSAALKKRLLAEAGPKLALQVVAKCRRLAAARPSSENAPKVSVND